MGRQTASQMTDGLSPIRQKPTRLIAAGAKLALGGALFLVAGNGCREPGPVTGIPAQAPLALELASEVAE